LRWLIEAILLQRILLEGHPQLRIIGWLARIREDELDAPYARDRFWSDAQYKLGKCRRLSPRDRDEIERLLAVRVPRPAAVPAQTPATPGTHSVAGPHSPLTGLAERARRSERARSTA
jgi:hypothetical protein